MNELPMAPDGATDSEMTNPADMLGRQVSDLPDGILLQPDMPPARAARLIVAFHFRRLLENEAGTVEGADAEALHDMRVATRRIRAAFRVFRSLIPSDELEPLVEEVRWLAGLLGNVRDLDVFLEWLVAFENAAPEENSERASVREVIAHWQEEREKERECMLEGLRSSRYQELKALVFRFVEPAFSPLDAPVTGKKKGRASEKQLRSYARKAIKRQIRSARSAARKAKKSDLDSLHRLRIACKRLRYTAEFFAGLFAPGLGILITSCVAVQDALGAMRDAQLQAERLERLMEELPPDSDKRRAAQSMLDALQERERQQYKEFKRVCPKWLMKKGDRKTGKWLQKPVS